MADPTCLAGSVPARVARRDVHGVLFLDKPPGLSSNQALQRVKRAFGAHKAGHTGTLDVAAGGLLPLCFGEATKFGAFLLDADKRYQAEITFGIRTSTGDGEGEVIARAAVADLDSTTLAAVLAALEGPQDQVPPMYSALKRDGQPLYRLARRGLDVPRAPRRITVHRFSLLRLEGARAWVEVVCSKGTYVRSLAETVGNRLGCGAYLSALNRVGVGPFDLTQAHPLDLFDGKRPAALLDELLLPPDCLVGGLPRLDVDAATATALGRGQLVSSVDAPATGQVRLYAAAEFLGIGEALGAGRVVPRRLVASRPGTGRALEPGI